MIIKCRPNFFHVLEDRAKDNFWRSYNESEQSQRFNAVFSGYSWWIIDRETQDWFKCYSAEEAEDKAAQMNYEWDEMNASRELLLM